ncbi:pyocin knob domain-containing protein [Eubacterium sp.]|uniref:pyocin knob domain-containing protein n=1 Tax=Eubacterium sp. TaxID=142586 RepID=UPI0026E1033D|nr:pyocin knob domain-containing protein [Eubacterium sp.]MDO5434130.1 pyocin knob domain-containing protein [Eubacterium sp.]
MKLFGKEFTFNGFDVFHKGNKPTKTDVGLGNVDNVKQYSPSNKPTPAAIGAEPAFVKNNAFNKSFGTAAGTVCQGNDARLSDARTPKAHTHTKSQITDFPASLPANGGTSSYTNYLNANNIAANTDLNSLTTPGFYYSPANATVATFKNCPTANALFLIVGKHAGVYQEIVEYMTASPKRFMRNYYSGTWGPWYRVFTTSNPPTYAETGALAAGGTAANALKVNGLTVLTAVPAGAKFTDTLYTHPAYRARASGLYKITVDANGHVSAVTAVAKADITALGIPGQDTIYTHPTAAGNKHIPAGGSAGQILRWSSAGTAVWGADNNTTYAVFTASANGLVPASGGGTAKFLRADGTWQVPPSGSGGNTVTVNTTEPSNPKKNDIWI